MQIQSKGSRKKEIFFLVVEKNGIWRKINKPQHSFIKKDSLEKIDTLLTKVIKTTKKGRDTNKLQQECKTSYKQ